MKVMIVSRENKKSNSQLKLPVRYRKHRANGWALEQMEAAFLLLVQNIERSDVCFVGHSSRNQHHCYAE